MRKIGLVFVLGLLLFACKTKKEVVNVVHAPVTEKELCNRATLTGQKCIDNINNLTWTQLSNNSDCTARGCKLSNNFILFEVDDDLLKSTIKRGLKTGESIVLTLPMYSNNQVECITAELVRSGTISKEMENRTGIYSFKGTADDMTLRVDYNEDTGLKVLYRRTGLGAYMEPVTVSNKFYYVCFNESSSTRTKQPFER